MLCNEANAIWMAFDRGPIEGDAVYPWIAADIADVLSTKKRTCRTLNRSGYVRMYIGLHTESSR